MLNIKIAKTLNFDPMIIQSKFDESFFLTILKDQILENSDLTITIKDQFETYADVENVNNSLTEFRGYQKGNEIVAFYTKYETDESILHIIFHELFHYVIDRDLGAWCLLKSINQYYLKDKKIIENTKINYMKDKKFEEEYERDVIHDNIPEEKLANDFATYIVGDDYDRRWWRYNIQMVDDYEAEDIEEDEWLPEEEQPILENF